MSKSTYELTSEDFDLPVLEPRWPDPDAPTGPDQRGRTRPTRPRPKLPRLWIAGLVIAAAVSGSVSTHALDRSAPIPPPAWTAACQDAINATARFHQLQNLRLAQGLDSVLALVAGVHPNTKQVDTATARLRRDAENAIARCVSPAAPLSNPPAL
jgi:hypothetical protein